MNNEPQNKPGAADDFEPNHIPFDEGLDRIKEALAQVGLDLDSRILTSRDADAVKACNLLAVDQMPEGFTKWQLPFSMECGQFFITSAERGASVGEHSHPDNGVRFIISGSIIYDGIELNAGDWMFIPKGKRYSFKVGPYGATMCYCYCCTCACRPLSQREVIDPDYVSVRQSLR